MSLGDTGNKKGLQEVTKGMLGAFSVGSDPSTDERMTDLFGVTNLRATVLVFAKCIGASITCRPKGSQ